MGVVYKAEDPALKRSVALKAMLPTLAASASAGKRFLREAQAMAAVKHDHVVTIYQVDQERGIPFLAMEFLAGEMLVERLEREEKLPLLEVVRIGREIAEGLAAAHATGLIHRDIKPANIWLEAPKNRVKILDFGLARATSEDSHLTQQGTIMGTPAFMAPEQGRGETVDARADLFSLGVVLYRLCTGQQPFVGRDPVSTIVEVALHEPPPPAQLDPGIPRELSALVMKLLEKDPARRPASADDVVDVLSALEKRLARQREPREDSKTVPSAPPPPAVAAARSRSRRPLLIGALVLLGLLIGGVTLALVLFRTSEGDYVIDTDDPDFAFQVSKDGGVTLEDRKNKRTYQMKVLRQQKGEFDLEVAEPAADLVFQTKTFTIKRGNKVALKAWFERRQDKGIPRKVDEAWLKKVAAMPAEEQAKAVMARMKDLNPGFDGKATPTVQGGVVTELRFLTDKVKDISPVRALTGLRTLTCNGSDWGKGQLADLSPLTNLKLVRLSCSFTTVTDLTPLKDMKLASLDCSRTQVSDLTPLKDMKLASLHCANTKVADLSPLRGMPLTILACYVTEVADLSPLKGMKLTTLACGNTLVKDLTPLKDMKLTVLDCANTKVADLSPLRGMPLVSLNCPFNPGRDLALLRSLETLETINGQPAKVFLNRVVKRRPKGGKPWRLMTRNVVRHEQLLKIVAGGEADVIFLGDSITQAWETAGKKVWAEHFAPLKAVNLGIGGDQNAHVLWRITEGKELEPIKPKVAVLLIGTNNMSRHSAKRIADGVEDIVLELRKQKPEMKILLLGIFPRAARPMDEIRGKIKATNAFLAQLDDGKMVFYKDIGERFLDKDGSLDKAIMPDFLHLSEKGYEIWAKAIKDDLRKLLAK
jgi:serine/threonine protein kinase/lysophospholipase L1-like esterase